MGGFGSGGIRAGAGRKSKDKATRWLGGSADKRAGREKTAPSQLIEAVDPPSDLSASELSVWQANAPHALAARTLVPGTAEAFREFCENVVRARLLWARIESFGLDYEKVTIDGSGQEHTERKANSLLSHHRGMLQRVEAARARFKLAPNGKEITAPAKAEDPFSEFDGDTVQ